VIHPQAGQFLTPVSLIGIASGIFMALAQVMLRHLAKIKESTDKIVFHLYVSCTVISLAFILFEKFFVGHNIVKVHSGGHAMFVIIMLITLGCISLIAQRILTKAFSHMPAAKLAPFLYVSIPISSIIGWAFWSQQLDINFYLGGVMILIGILFITLDSKKEKICTLHKQQHKHSLKGVN
jgi:drug/metabolite transporter (DMT)-like permease